MSNTDLAAIEKLQNELSLKFSELSVKISKIIELLLKQRAVSLNSKKKSPIYTQIAVTFFDESGEQRINTEKIKKEDYVCYLAACQCPGNWHSDWPKDYSSIWCSMPVRWLNLSESDLIAEVSAIFKKHEADKALKEKKAKTSAEKKEKNKKVAAAKAAFGKLSAKERQDLLDLIDKEAERSHS